jgi:hypothetical protein
MAIQMYKGKVSEIVANRDVKTRLEDGWTFKPSQPKATFKFSKDKIKASAEVENKQTDPTGPEDLNKEEQ